MTAPAGEFEDGLQRERTALAWNRTALALVVAGILLIRYLGAPYFDLFHLPAYSTLVAGIVVLWLAAIDDRWRSHSGSAQLRPRRAWAVGMITLALNISSLLIVAFGR
jgi:uncharacterized membrane protein YidH (DUF202 family)